MGSNTLRLNKPVDLETRELAVDPEQSNQLLLDLCIQKTANSVNPKKKKRKRNPQLEYTKNRLKQWGYVTRTYRYIDCPRTYRTPMFESIPDESIHYNDKVLEEAVQVDRVVGRLSQTDATATEALYLRFVDYIDCEGSLNTERARLFSLNTGYSESSYSRALYRGIWFVCGWL